MRPLPIVVMLLAFACGEEDFDPTPIGSIEGYASWRKVFDAPLAGPVPGHGDTIRQVYVNDEASRYSHAGAYRVGTILVKEIRENDGALGGAIEYVSVMRKLAPAGPDPGVPIEGGWVFSYTTEDGVGGDETYWDLCWAQCHRQAPWDGAWFDYGL